MAVEQTGKSVLNDWRKILGAVAGLLLVGILTATFVASSMLSGVANEEIRVVASGTSDTLILIFVLFAVGAVGILFYALRSLKPGGDRALGPVLDKIATGDYEGGLRVLKETGLQDARVATLVQGLARKQQTIGDSLNQQRVILERIGSATTSLGELLNQQMDGLRQLQNDSTDSQKLLAGFSGEVDGLSRGAEETSSSILEMVAINNEVTENIHNLAMSVQETTTAIEEMTFSVKEVARNIEDLSTASEETAASMNQMDVSISQVESNANETSKLSETVTSDAETGVTAITKTIQGIDRIKESSRSAAEVMGSLGEKINEIGNILTVIDEVAEQTNLLALNAAIIAAQAGEHGRGFAVVADEIKALAERTGASTKEIADLIKTVQSESRNAITTMSKGVEAVDEGVQLGHNAEEALIKIVDSAKRSTLMIKAIAQATVEQAKGSKQVTNAISRIAETVQQIALATSEQAKGSEQIMKSAERMRTITQQVERSTEEQNRGGRQVTDAIERIRDIVDRLEKSHQGQANNSARIAEAIATIADKGERGAETTRAIEAHLSQATSDMDRRTERPL